MVGYAQRMLLGEEGANGRASSEHRQRERPEAPHLTITNPSGVILFTSPLGVQTYRAKSVASVRSSLEKAPVSWWLW